MNKIVGGVVFCILGCCYYGSYLCFAARNTTSSTSSASTDDIPTTASTLSDDGTVINPESSSDVSDLSSAESSIKNIREKCKEAQQLEQDITYAETDINNFNQKEKNTAPILKSTYELLTRCFTLLFNIQRFSKLLAISPEEKGKDKNDFVRCSIIIKNFSQYFNSVSEELSKNTNEIIAIKKKRQKKIREIAEKQQKHTEIKKFIKQNLPERLKGGEESMIENVVYHIATKSNSIEELDAELESENAVGVLKNTKVNTELALVNPVVGKLVNEFGDKSKNGSMIYSLGFETRKGAIVTSPAKGLIVFSGKFLNYGNMVIISNGDYRIFLYGLSDDMYVMTGDVVEVGDYLGITNDEARASNPIVEMELRKFGEPLDPRHWLMQTMDKDAKTSETKKKNGKDLS